MEKSKIFRQGDVLLKQCAMPRSVLEQIKDNHIDRDGVEDIKKEAEG